MARQHAARLASGKFTVTVMRGNKTGASYGRSEKFCSEETSQREGKKKAPKGGEVGMFGIPRRTSVP